MSSRHSYVRFYTTNWIAGTARLNRLQRSIYFDVCLHNWDKVEAMPLAEQAIVFADIPDWKEQVELLVDAGKLKRTKGRGIYSDRAMIEARCAADRLSISVRSGKQGAAKRWQNNEKTDREPIANKNLSNKEKKEETPLPPFEGGVSDLFGGQGDAQPVDIAEHYPAAFETWWSEYPNKTGKGRAAKSYEAAFKRLGGAKVGSQRVHGKLLIALKAQRRVWKRKGVEGQYIPHATTWLNQSRYDDDAVVAEMKRPANGNGADLDAAAELQPLPERVRPACDDCGAPPGMLHKADCSRRPKPSGWVPGEPVS